MKKVWLFVIVALFVQEPASMDAAIFQIRNLHLSILLFIFLWFVATCFDIWFGYKIGKWIQAKSKGGKFEAWSSKWATRVENFIGEKGEKFALVLLGIINFPYANSFLASWLKISYKTMFTLVLIGDGIYFIIAWIINIWVRNYFINPHTALYVIIGIGLLSSVLAKTIMNKVLKNNETPN